MRDVIKTAETGKELLTERRDITTEEIKQLFNLLIDVDNPNAAIDCMRTAYYFGAAVGYRQAKAEK